MHPASATVCVPREAGLLYSGVRSTYILGLQIGSILSRFYRVLALSEGGQKIGNRIEFFCRLECTEGWFFDIYIQGSKKIQLLRAESEIKRLSQDGQRVSVITI